MKETPFLQGAIGHALLQFMAPGGMTFVQNGLVKWSSRIVGPEAAPHRGCYEPRSLGPSNLSNARKKAVSIIRSAGIAQR